MFCKPDPESRSPGLKVQPATARLSTQQLAPAWTGVFSLHSADLRWGLPAFPSHCPQLPGCWRPSVRPQNRPLASHSQKADSDWSRHLVTASPGGSSPRLGHPHHFPPTLKHGSKDFPLPLTPPWPPPLPSRWGKLPSAPRQEA